MSIKLKVPEVGESIQEVQIVKWLKQEGDTVAQDETVAELESEKASLELPASTAGTLTKILKQAGETVAVGDTIAEIEEGNDRPSETSEKKENRKKAKKEKKRSEKEMKNQAKQNNDDDNDETARKSQDSEKQTGNGKSERKANEQRPEVAQATVPATPSARRELRKHGLTAEEVTPQGDRLRPEDVRRHVREHQQADEDQEEGRDRETLESELERSVPMTFIRRRIAQRLVEAQQNAALLTTYNEIDMSRVMRLRNEYREPFAEIYDVKLGYMSFFVKAAIDALRHFPQINAEVRGDSILYRDYYHIGIAVGAGEGLVVPVLRFAERMSFAEIEEAIDDFSARAQSKELEPAELQNGTFTISNGGIYGSLLSTPIVNPPQSGVLGMHAIVRRPVARGNEIVIRPMMYVALTYDHRVVDGREAVLFLKRVKAAIEEPARMLMEV